MPAGNMYQSTFEGGIEHLAAIRQFIHQATLDLGCNEDDIFACELATDEAASNAFEHAYAGRGGRIEVKAWREGDSCMICVRNWGVPFDPAAIPEPDLLAPLDERSMGGLGIFLIRKVMDHVSFTFDAAEGNTIVMRRKLAREGT